MHPICDICKNSVEPNAFCKGVWMAEVHSEDELLTSMLSEKKMQEATVFSKLIDSRRESRYVSGLDPSKRLDLVSLVQCYREGVNGADCARSDLYVRVGK